MAQFTLLSASAVRKERSPYCAKSGRLLIDLHILNPFIAGCDGPEPVPPLWQRAAGVLPHLCPARRPDLDNREEDAPTNFLLK
jgi:hypothetical protein